MARILTISNKSTNHQGVAGDVWVIIIHSELSVVFFFSFEASTLLWAHITIVSPFFRMTFFCSPVVWGHPKLCLVTNSAAVFLMFLFFILCIPQNNNQHGSFSGYICTTSDIIFCSYCCRFQVIRCDRLNALPKTPFFHSFLLLDIYIFSSWSVWRVYAFS